MNPNKIIATLLIIFSLYSCTKDVDFNQLDDANIHTTYLVTLIHLNLTAIKFLDDFYNEFSEPIYYLQPVIIVPENSLELTTIIEIPLEDIPAIYETQYFGFNLKLSPSADGSVISGADTTTIDLKSSVKLFFNFRKIWENLY